MSMCTRHRMNEYETEKKNKKKKKWPVVNAFWSCPLKPVAHGLTVTTLFLLKKRNPKAERNINIEPPTTPDHISFVWCFVLKLLKLGTNPGEGAKGSTSGTKGAVGGFGKTGNGGSTGDGDGAAIGDGEGDSDMVDGGIDIDETGIWNNDGKDCNSFLSVASPAWIAFLQDIKKSNKILTF